MPRVSDAKERLMEAVCDLIWEHSYGTTSVDLICARAKVKKGSFYHFFESKADLAVAAIEAGWQSKKAQLDQIFSPTAPPLERLRHYTALLYQKQSELKAESGCVLGCPLFSLGSEVGTQEQAIRAKVDDILARNVRYLESAIRDAHARGDIVAPDATCKAKLLFGYYQGALTQARIQNSLEPLSELYGDTLELLGVKKPELLSA
jgi:TetR/AcrR family transcriptional repressor of nem operon